MLKQINSALVGWYNNNKNLWKFETILVVVFLLGESCFESISTTWRVNLEPYLPTLWPGIYIYIS
jgi:hypothetical protein